MRIPRVFAAIILVFVSGSSCLDLTFPDGFLLGVGTSACQTEGAWNLSDKAESVVDHWVHYKNDEIWDGSNGDVASDSYHKYKEDVQLVKRIGFDVYRFSISWARLLPNGFSNEISADGLAFYKNLLQELADNGIKSMVTLYHFDHPQSVEEMGGWLNEAIVQLFVDYARVVFDELGSMVDIFLTVNEPDVFCYLGYQGDPLYTLSPGKTLGKYAQYMCMHNVLKAHASVWHMYDEEYRSKYNGRIGMADAFVSYQPLNASIAEDYEAAENGFQFNVGWSSHAIWLGDYPEIMRSRVAMISEIEGYRTSRMPSFSQEWIDYIKGASDFIGINYYRTYTARLQTDEEFAAAPEDGGIVYAQVFDQDIVALGFRLVLNQLKNNYNNAPIIITENGYTETSGDINDYDRIAYFNQFLTKVLEAVKEDGCNVIGYMVWSLIDAFELFSGYTWKFGLHHVDFDSDNRTRTPRLSADWWKTVIETREVQPALTGSTSS